VNHVPLIPQTAPTWRDAVIQDAPPRPRNRVARRRLALASVRHWVAVGAAAACLIFGYIGWRAWRDNPAVLAAPASAAPLREIALRTDGVLTRAWVEQTLKIDRRAGLMDLDLAALRDRLLQSGQIRTAVLARRFPDVLAVILEERSPVLRVHARAEAGAPGDDQLFVARDGFVFTGELYPAHLVENLPLLAGITPARNPAGLGFAPVEGLESVASLLGTARSSAPALAKEFQVVSLARYARDGVIVVRTPEVTEIAFGTRDDFYLQIARLDYILEQLRARPAGAVPIRSIDLSVGGRQVPVAFDAPPVPAKPAPASRAPARTAEAARPPKIFFHP